MQKMVLISWVDSGGNDLIWEFKNERESLEPHKCETVGFVVEEHEKYITVAQSQNADQWGRQFCIPRAAVTEINELKLAIDN